MPANSAFGFTLWKVRGQGRSRTSDLQGWRKCKRIVGNNPCLCFATPARPCAMAAPTIRGFDEFPVGASLLANLHGPVLLACPRCWRSRRFEAVEVGVSRPGFTTDFGNHRRGWSRLEPAAKGVELVFRPAHKYFDAAIEQISCPPGQSEGKRLFAR